MPIHEFLCTSCGHRFEELLFGAEKAVCPKCQGDKLDKLMSTFAVSAPSSGELPPGCGTCGDPRGPGACSMN